MNPVSKLIYLKANETIEKWTKYIEVSIIYISLPAIILPFLFVTGYLYIKMDMGHESFYLPFLAW